MCTTGKQGLVQRIRASVRSRIRGGRIVRDKAQEGEGDLAFLPRLGKRHDAQFSIEDGRALWLMVGDGKSAEGRNLPRRGVALEVEVRGAAEFDCAVANFTLSMPGRPEVRAGHLVDCPTRFPVVGLWYVAEAQHVYDGGGLTTRLRPTAANGRG